MLSFICEHDFFHDWISDFINISMYSKWTFSCLRDVVKAEKGTTRPCCARWEPMPSSTSSTIDGASGENASPRGAQKSSNEKRPRQPWHPVELQGDGTDGTGTKWYKQVEDGKMLELSLNCCRDQRSLVWSSHERYKQVMYVMWVMYFLAWNMLELVLSRAVAVSEFHPGTKRLSIVSGTTSIRWNSSTNPRSPQIHPNTIGNHLDTPDFHQLLQGTIFMFTYFTSYVDKPSSHSWIELDCQRLEREIPWEQWLKPSIFQVSLPGSAAVHPFAILLPALAIVIVIKYIYIYILCVYIYMCVSCKL